MTTHLRRLTAVIPLASALILAAGVAMADPSDDGVAAWNCPMGGPSSGRGHHGAGPGEGYGMGGYGMAGFADPARIDALKTRLAIRPDQEAAWAAYAQSLHDAAADWTRSDQTRIQTGSADWPARMVEMRGRHLDNMRAMLAAAGSLAQGFDDTQRATAQWAMPGLAIPCHDGQGRGQGRGHGHGRGMW